ncbi:MAG: JAB domain-containing protein [Armatimonadetes bacterium]|nr:JAB domain-containing protein [Armatimonadota bacterium]MDE2205459.1 JAB domain-containing protein [Armatimonadota bacterium]
MVARARANAEGREQTSLEHALFYEPEVSRRPARESALPVFRIELVRDNPADDHSQHTIRSPEEAARIFERYLKGADRENFVTMFLDTKSRVIGLNTVSIGTLDSALVHPREVFKPAILANASSVIVCHNHPSGDPQPSPEDRQVTARLAEAAKVLGIDLLDHVVVGCNGKHCSLKQLGVF